MDHTDEEREALINRILENPLASIKVSDSETENLGVFKEQSFDADSEVLAELQEIYSFRKESD
ncbi:hypothetical protein [Succinatimonas hippei]|uniref:hypothetical protein n=1 Tax=Succinatimonas hippei TaxID=626938 RepID=UPI0023F7EB08|nr:hypothetical protein [Succinatimonas hippei]